MGHHLSPQEQLLETFHCQKISSQFFPHLSHYLLPPSVFLSCPAAIPSFFSTPPLCMVPSKRYCRSDSHQPKPIFIDYSKDCILFHVKALTDFSPPVSDNGILFFPKEMHGKLPLIPSLQPLTLMMPFCVAQCEGNRRESVGHSVFDHTCRPSFSKARQRRAGKDINGKYVLGI